MLGPLAALSAFVVNEAAQGVKFVTDIVRSERVIELIEAAGAGSRPTAEALQRLPQAQGASAAAAGWAAVAATGQFVFHAVLMLIALFFLLIQGDASCSGSTAYRRCESGQTRELLAEFKSVSARSSRRR